MFSWNSELGVGAGSDQVGCGGLLAMVLNWSMHQNYLEDLFGHRLLNPITRGPDSGKSGIAAENFHF